MQASTDRRRWCHRTHYPAPWAILSANLVLSDRERGRTPSHRRTGEMARLRPIPHASDLRDRIIVRERAGTDLGKPFIRSVRSRSAPDKLTLSRSQNPLLADARLAIHFSDVASDLDNEEKGNQHVDRHSEEARWSALRDRTTAPCNAPAWAISARDHPWSTAASSSRFAAPRHRCGLHEHQHSSQRGRG